MMNEQKQQEAVEESRDMRREPRVYWIARYYHRHGEDYGLFQHKPTEDEMLTFFSIEGLAPDELEWNVEARGPFEVNK
jgi:hypothetical protein